MAKTQHDAPVRVEHITQTILLLRGQRVILDAEIAALYDVTTKRLDEQVKRNAERFPEDFMFRLSRTETEALNRSQIATGSQKHRNPRFPPFAFTEHGAIMAATILNSPRAVEMSVYVVRAFVQLAVLLNVSQQTINAYEVGRRRMPVSSLPPIARYLGVSVEELIGEPASPAAKKRGPTPKIQQQLERIQRLPKAQQRFVMKVIDSVLAQQQSH
jgi:transcriptional regulator with XRE-family HTH domain